MRFILQQSDGVLLLEKEESGVAPHFVEPLKPQIVEEKAAAVLQCKVVGKPTPNVKWFKDNKEVVPSATRQITYNPQSGVATLELLEPTPEDEKVFTVKADNKFGQAQCRANLIISKAVIVTQPMVMEAPRIIKPVKAVLARPEEEVVLEAKFEGIPAPEIKWYKNNKEIKPGEDYDIKVQEKQTVLKINKKVKKKGGKYEVHAVNPKGEVRSSGTVTVTQTITEEAQPPQFIQPINPQYATVGEVVILEAEVESFPAASFQWFQKMTPIISTPEMKIVSEENRSTLIMTDVTPEQAGTITCRAENAVGSVTCTASLNVVEETEWEETRELEYPRFIKPLIPIRVMDGEKVTFQCVVTGKPIPKVQWYHNDLPVKEAKDVVISQSSEGVCMLAIAEVFPENAGVYTCKAVNKVGEAVCKSSLIVEGRYHFPQMSTKSTNISCSLRIRS
jgi:titin